MILRYKEIVDCLNIISDIIKYDYTVINDRVMCSIGGENTFERYDGITDILIHINHHVTPKINTDIIDYLLNQMPDDKNIPYTLDGRSKRVDLLKELIDNTINEGQTIVGLTKDIFLNVLKILRTDFEENGSYVSYYLNKTENVIFGICGIILNVCNTTHISNSMICEHFKQFVIDNDLSYTLSNEPHYSGYWWYLDSQGRNERIHAVIEYLIYLGTL